MSYAGGIGEYGLETIGKDGTIPVTRMKSARQVQDFALRLFQNDSKRSWKRSLVDGLVGGNPPYRAAKLRASGQANRCNVNWGTARMYLESGAGAYYDLFSEAPGMVIIRTDIGSSPEERDFYSQVMSEEADRILAEDEVWDFEMQQSQDQMVLHGRGPLMFEDPFKVLPRSFHDADLRVPERTKADTKYWETCTVDVDYYPPQLYEFIENEAAAAAAGWDVEYTKKVIQNAMNIRTPTNQGYTWEFYQQEIKNNSLSYYDDSKVCRVVFCFWKEMDGRITQTIVERAAANNTESEPRYMFFHRGRYANFKQAVHPMYMDRGNGGFHHSVTGLGVKMYGAMEYENRLLCNLMDKAFAPKVLFRPTSEAAKQKMELAHLSDYGLLPHGWEVEQTPIQGFLTDGMAMWQASSQLMRSNLSGYRQQVPMREQGNPATAREVMLKASEQSSLSKPTYARYYKQMDLLWAEYVRRLCILGSPDQRAKNFQERCINRGVPKEAFGRIAWVMASRVVGGGNSFQRQQAALQMGQVAASLPEDGRRNWLNDYIASVAGQSAVERYNPRFSVSRLPTDQEYEATQSIGCMKVGVPPLVTSSQNPVIYAKTYLKAATDAVNSLQQGGEPAEVYTFLQICGPAILAQLQRFANDPYRAPAFKPLFEQWKSLASIMDKLKGMLGRMLAQRQQQAEKQQQVMSDAELKQAKVQADIEMKKEKHDADLEMKREAHAHNLNTQAASAQQQLVISDAQTASEIHRQNQLAEAKAENERKRAEAQAEAAKAKAKAKPSGGGK